MAGEPAERDRLHWAQFVNLDFDGLQLGFRCNDEMAWQELYSLLPPWAHQTEDSGAEVVFSIVFGRESPRPGVFHYHLIYRGTELICRTLSWQEAAQAWLESVDQELSLRPKQVVYLDAELVTRNGRGVLIVGPADAAGALAHTLQKTGETAWIDGVVGLTATAQARMPTLEGRREVEIEALLVVDPRSNRSVRPARLPTWDAVMRMMGAARSMRSKPQETMQILAGVGPKVEAYLGSFVDGAAAVRFVDRRFGKPTR